MTDNTPNMPKASQPDIVGLSSAYATGTVIAPHAHRAHQIVHAISGTMRVMAQGRMWFVPPGRALWIPAQMQHAIECIGPVEMRTAYLSEAYPTAHSEVLVLSVSPLMREVLVRLADQADEALDLMLAQVLIAEIKHGTLEPLSLPIPNNPRIAKLARQMQTDPADQTPLTTWANQLGYSERSLIRYIRAETGMTFRELRRQTRIMVALDKLSAGQSVTETAFDVGFETPSAFIHAFRILMGQTPRQFMSGV
ncbi:helix-turn-helix domain-containing protein [Roseovarius sp. EL26]|uniref:AraC family transcriptional regulator n=1 Tax=Roseovarius sp. EL26 TaxID=2126672 RepID=UPI0013C4D257|nr:helix-turn-helix transcriptional regulator [Roseovarius sp. EL26]